MLRNNGSYDSYCIRWGFDGYMSEQILSDDNLENVRNHYMDTLKEHPDAKIVKKTIRESYVEV